MVSKNIIALRKPNSTITEAYRMLRTNLYFSGAKNKMQVFGFTSTDKNEGKTTTICNLAVTLAKDGHKVLIVDGDLRRPTVHKYFKVENHVGLTNLLIEDITLAKTAHILGVDKRIHLLTSGPLPPNPAELLGSHKTVELLEEARITYDYILVDAPPVGLVADAAILSHLVDGVILTVASKQTNIQNAVRARDLLKSANANILGVVITKVDTNKSEDDMLSYYG